jgi:hypothetical protein
LECQTWTVGWKNAISDVSASLLAMSAISNHQTSRAYAARGNRAQNEDKVLSSPECLNRTLVEEAELHLDVGLLEAVAVAVLQSINVRTPSQQD